MTPREIEKHMKKAKSFNREGCAYVHAEYAIGEGNPLIVGGDGVAMIRVVQIICERLSKLTGVEFDEVIGTVKAMHEAFGDTETKHS